MKPTAVIIKNLKRASSPFVKLFAMMRGLLESDGLLSLFMLSSRNNYSIYEIVFIGFTLLLAKAVHRYVDLDFDYKNLFRLSHSHCYVRTISHKKVCSIFYSQRGDAGYDNQLLQKAIVFRINNKSGIDWKTSDVGLASKNEWNRRRYYDDEDGPEDNVMDNFIIVSLPPDNEWVTIMKNGMELLQFKRRKFDRETADGKSTIETEIFTLRAYSCTEEKARLMVEEYIEDSITEYRKLIDPKKDTMRYQYIPCRLTDKETSEKELTFRRYALSDQRTFDTLYHPDKNEILNIVDNFVHKRGKYAIPGYPDKLGFLLYGPPGTGKTSFIKSLASYTKRHIVTVSFEKIKTNQELMDVMHDRFYKIKGDDLTFNPGFDEVIFVMEDIDAAAGLVRSRTKMTLEDSIIAAAEPRSNYSSTQNLAVMIKKDEDELNLAGVLNALDGVLDSPRRIVIMTSNHPDRLDPALIRPGRVNMKIHMSYIKPDQAQEMLMRYFSTTQLEISAHRDRLIDICKRKISPAALEAVCGQYDNIIDALSAIEQQQLHDR
ncbi:AAA family ATPase [Tetraselmis virus 1]|uniref:AAA family ATPase n=1 Tax=Tetraselmis virus 1 TaxID=2060617 RepID=A0A2P0VPD9_9VIRU|nr:AAA family ATPase [Tetraselmis virus 1]AUF82699.1 AAA family ATPase [Tetraselmis virus 1]